MMTLLTSDQQGWFLTGLMLLVIIGLGVYLYWIDKERVTQ